jgi:hypothetical protein
LTLVAAVVAVVVVVVVVVEIISTLVAVGRGGDYLDTGSGSSSSSSISESVLWTTNCPLVLAYSGLGDGGHFQWSLYTSRIQSVFLLFIKYTHDYPQQSWQRARHIVNKCEGWRMVKWEGGGTWCSCLWQRGRHYGEKYGGEA